jgi:hypothetical protein
VSDDVRLGSIGLAYPTHRFQIANLLEPGLGVEPVEAGKKSGVDCECGRSEKEKGESDSVQHVLFLLK